MKSELKLTLTTHGGGREDLEERIAEFKADPQRMGDATKFVDELLVTAQKEAESRAKAAAKEKKDSVAAGGTGPHGKSGHRMVNRARGMIVRWFESLCNCTHTAIGRRSVFKNRTQSQPQPQ